MAIDGGEEGAPLIVTNIAIVQGVVSYLSLRDANSLRSTCSAIRDTLTTQAGPSEMHCNKVNLSLRTESGGEPSSCFKCFQRWGHGLQALQLTRTPLSDRNTLPSLLAFCSQSLRRLSLHDLDTASYDVQSVGSAILSCVRLEALQLHCSDLSQYEAHGGPFAAVLVGLPRGRLPYLRKLTLFSRLDAAGTEALCAYLQSMDMTAPTTVHVPGLLASPYGPTGGNGSDVSSLVGFSLGETGGRAHGQATGQSTSESAGGAGRGRAGIVSPAADEEGAGTGAGAPASSAIQGVYGAARRLTKLKLSTSVLSSPGGSDVLVALCRAQGLRKLTIIRPEGLGEPIRKAQCALLARVLVRCRTLQSLHLRRAGMWTDTLAALVPPSVCPNINNLKLDSNSLGYLSGVAFNDAIDALLSRLPALEAIHAGNNSMSTDQAIALAHSVKAHKLVKLTNLTLGSNDIGDAGLDAILKALPSGMQQCVPVCPPSSIARSELPLPPSTGCTCTAASCATQRWSPSPPPSTACRGCGASA